MNVRIRDDGYGKPTPRHNLSSLASERIVCVQLARTAKTIGTRFVFIHYNATLYAQYICLKVRRKLVGVSQNESLEDVGDCDNFSCGGGRRRRRERSVFPRVMYRLTRRSRLEINLAAAT